MDSVMEISVEASIEASDTVNITKSSILSDEVLADWALPNPTTTRITIRRIHLWHGSSLQELLAAELRLSLLAIVAR